MQEKPEKQRQPVSKSTSLQALRQDATSAPTGSEPATQAATPAAAAAAKQPSAAPTIKKTKQPSAAPKSSAAPTVKKTKQPSRAPTAASTVTSKPEQVIAVCLVGAGRSFQVRSPLPAVLHIIIICAKQPRGRCPRHYMQEDPDAPVCCCADHLCTIYFRGVYALHMRIHHMIGRCMIHTQVAWVYNNIFRSLTNSMPAAKRYPGLRNNGPLN